MRTSEAAAALGISPHTLRSWERRFGFPRPLRSPGNHRLYLAAEVSLLGEALREGLAASSAISRARESSETQESRLCAALARIDADAADAVMNRALSINPVETAVEQLLLTACSQLRHRYGKDSAVWSFASAWAIDWLHRFARLFPGVGGGVVFVGDATQGVMDPTALLVAAIDAFLQRLGARTVRLPVVALGQIADVVAAAPPRALLVAGHSAPEETRSRWVAAVVESVGSKLVVASYLGSGHHRSGGGDELVLPGSPSAAAMRLRRGIAGATRAAPASARFQQSRRPPAGGLVS